MKEYINYQRYINKQKRRVLGLGVRTVLSGMFCFSVICSSVLPSAAQTPITAETFLPFVSANSSQNEIQTAQKQGVSVEIKMIENYQYKATGVDVVMEQVAKGLAVVVEDVNVRKMIQAEADLKFDGDTNFLYSTIANRNIAEKQQSFTNAIAAANFSTNSASKRQFMQSTDGIKNLQIYVHALDDWNVEKHAPLVAVRSENDPQDGTNKYALRAFDGNGRSFWLDSSVAPKQPVIVIGISERVGEDGVPYRNKPNNTITVVNSMNMNGNDSEVAVNAAAVNATAMSSSSTNATSVKATTIMATPPDEPRRVCIRPAGSVETLDRFRLKNFVWQEWFDGAPEVTLKIVGEKGIQVFENTWEYHFGSGSIAPAFYIYPNMDLHEWRPDQYGGFMSYFWSEEDSRKKQVDWEIGASSSIKIPGETGVEPITVSLKVNISEKDEKLGQLLVNCRGAIPATLSTSDIEWNLSSSGGDMPIVNATLPVSVACNESITLDGSASQDENRYLIEIYPTTGISGTSVEGNYYSNWTLDDRPIAIDLASIYPFKVLAGESSTVYRVKLAVSNHPVNGSWREKVQYVTVNATASSSFNVPSPVAQGQPVIMDPTGSTGETAYYLEVYRTSGYGTSDVTGPLQYDWFNQPANNAIPLHSWYNNFSPGWYRVRLGVINSCTNLQETVNWVQITQ